MRLGDGRLEAVKGLVVQLLLKVVLAIIQFLTFPLLQASCKTYRSAGNNQLDLTTGGAHELAELVANALQDAQSVVLGESRQEVLDGLVGSRGAQGLLQLLNNGALIGIRQGRCAQDSGELGVLGNDVVQGVEGLGGRIERGGLDGGSVLNGSCVSSCSAIMCSPSRPRCPC